MTQNHQNSLYLYDYCGHAFLQDISEYLSSIQVDRLPWQHSRRRVTPVESKRVDLANAVISGILQNKEKS
jgi:hypothetical protein